MAVEKRCPNSKAKLFVPSKSEREMKHKRKTLNDELAEVQSLKEDLKNMMEEVKNK